MRYLLKEDNFSCHMRHLITCDEYGNKPFLRGVRNHMAIAPEMMELWYLVKENQPLSHVPGVEDALRKLESKLDDMYRNEKRVR